MKTRQFSAQDMERQIARFRQLEPQKNAFAKFGIPVEAMEMIAAKNIYLLMTPKGAAGSAAGAGGSTASSSIEGQPGLTVNIVECPPGQGPMLHVHQRTCESFLCLTGRFEVRWGDQGEQRTEIQPFDLIAVPAGVARAFRNIDTQSSLLLVLTQSSGADDYSDIEYAPEVGEEIVRRFGAPTKAAFEAIGISFTAGVESPLAA